MYNIFFVKTQRLFKFSRPEFLPLHLVFDSVLTLMRFYCLTSTSIQKKRFEIDFDCVTCKKIWFKLFDISGIALKVSIYPSRKITQSTMCDFCKSQYRFVDTSRFSNKGNASRNDKKCIKYRKILTFFLITRLICIAL